MKKTRALVASALASVALVGGIAAQPAEANSFASAPAQGGYYSYKDGYDRFCVRATTPGYRLVAELSPVRAGHGPSFTVTNRWDDYRTECSTALARAYEDTKYKVIVRSYYNGVYKSSKTDYFFS